MLSNERARRGRRRAGQGAQFCAGIPFYYNATRRACQALCHLLSRAIMGLALALVNVGDHLAGAALRLACEVCR
jgi:hypothetical protein